MREGRGGENGGDAQQEVEEVGWAIPHEPCESSFCVCMYVYSQHFDINDKTSGRNISQVEMLETS